MYILSAKNRVVRRCRAQKANNIARLFLRHRNVGCSTPDNHSEIADPAQNGYELIRSGHTPCESTTELDEVCSGPELRPAISNLLPTKTPVYKTLLSVETGQRTNWQGTFGDFDFLGRDKCPV